jgi:flagellar basal-body rod protein FlgB
VIEGITNSGDLPVLERLMQFSSRRQTLISSNIANISTPGYRPVDVSVEGFQDQLATAIDARRERGGDGPLAISSSSTVELTPEGMTLHPRPPAISFSFMMAMTGISNGSCRISSATF